jgi:MFS family permease
MNKTKTAILSISLLNIMMNAGIVPVISRIAAVFPEATPTELKLTLSIAALFSIIFSLLTGFLDRFISKKILLASGLFFYAMGGMGTGLANSMAGLLAFRALLGVGAGICLPLATAFIADFYEGEERKQAIGYSFFAANLAAIILPILGARLGEINWRYSFSVYGIALVVLVFTWFAIPDRAKPEKKLFPRKKLFYFSGPVIAAAFTYFFVTMLFLSLPSNISIFLDKEGIGTPSTAAMIGAVSTLMSMIFSLNFARINDLLKDWMLTLALVFCGLGFVSLSLFKGLAPVIIGQSLIGAAMGMFHPFFPYKATQVAPKDQTTSALSLVSSGFRMGTFVSPFFFLYAGSLANVTTIRGEFLMTALIFCGTMIFSAFVFLRRKQIEPIEPGEPAETA